MSSKLSPPPSLRQRSSSMSVRPPALILPPSPRRRLSAAPEPETPVVDSTNFSNNSTPAPSLASSSSSSPLSRPPISSSSSSSPTSSSSSSSSDSAPAMLAVVLSRLIQLVPSPGSWHSTSLIASTPSTVSPRSSTDTILPMSAPADQTVFLDIYPEKDRVRAPRAAWRSYPSVHAPILFVLTLFPLSTAIVLFAMSTLPITAVWPHNITDLAQLGRELQMYTQSGPRETAHVISVMAVTAVWKHAWSIPGSVLWNVLAGALFTPTFATVLLTTLTTIGSICATLLAMPLAPLITQFLPKVLAMTRNALEGDNAGAELTTGAKRAASPAWVRLSVLRLIGVVPWSGINIACGVCGVSLFDCALGTFIGTLPWTAVTCQIGDILQTVASQPSPTPQSIQSLVASPEILAKLVFLSFLSLAPILGRDRLRDMLTPRADATPSEERGRWAWVQEWRVRIRVPSRACAATTATTAVPLGSQRELEVLVREKQALDEA